MISKIDIEHQAITAKRELNQLADFVRYYQSKKDRERLLKDIDDAETSVAKVLSYIRKG